MPATTKAGSIACRSAPTENSSSGDQITRPLYSASASSTAAASDSATSGLMAFIFEWMLAISTSPSSVQTRTSPSSLIVVPAVRRIGCVRTQHALGEQLARMHRQLALRHELVRAMRSTDLSGVHAAQLRPPALRTPTSAAARC